MAGHRTSVVIWVAAHHNISGTFTVVVHVVIVSVGDDGRVAAMSLVARAHHLPVARVGHWLSPTVLWRYLLIWIPVYAASWMVIHWLVMVTVGRVVELVDHILLVLADIIVVVVVPCSWLMAVKELGSGPLPAFSWPSCSSGAASFLLLLGDHTSCLVARATVALVFLIGKRWVLRNRVLLLLVWVVVVSVVVAVTCDDFTLLSLD